MNAAQQTVTCINPNLVLQEHDLFTTGIVYTPVSLAWFASSIRAAGFTPQVIDAFGEAPNSHWQEEDFVFRGLRPEEVTSRVAPEALAVVLYAINLTYHRSLIAIVKRIRAAYSKLPIIILENTQAVTAYSLRKVQEEFYAAGASFVITGEGEERGVELLTALAQRATIDELKRIDGIGFPTESGVHYSLPLRKIKNLDTLPFPAWELFPLENYWSLHYSHGPFTSTKYMPLLTSRGCPYTCRFCVIPETNDVKWRARSAKNVVDEIEHWYHTKGVTEFHVEDVDPTVKDSRTREICGEIVARKLPITWKLVSGTKVETMKNEETVALMAEAGCRYISISPESGSPKVMKLINKPFDLEHAIALVKKMKEVGIRSQACFVLGFPGEEDEDRELTRQMAKRLVQVGLDEIAIFVITPVPGSEIFSEFSGYEDYSQLHFSPTWRSDYEKLNRYRIMLYRSFLLWKLRYHPLAILKQPFNFIRRKFETKMEMVPYRALHTFFMLKGFLGRRVAEVSTLSPTEVAKQRN